MTTDRKSEITRYLYDRWQGDGGETAVLERGTRLFHGGVVRNLDGFKQPRPTWFASGRGAEEYALSYTKTGYPDQKTFLLVCRARRPLRCARFLSTDFFKFIDDYCGGISDNKRSELYQWDLSKEGLDGIFFDCEHPEVALFWPNSDLLLLVSCDPTARGD